MVFTVLEAKQKEPRLVRLAVCVSLRTDGGYFLIYAVGGSPPRTESPPVDTVALSIIGI